MNETLLKHISGKATTLTLPDDITDLEIAEMHHGFEWALSNINWLLGDFYAHVAKVRPTKQADHPDQLHLEIPVERNERVQTLMQNSAHSRGLHRMACRVSSIIPAKHRKPSLPWAFHALVLEECGIFTDGVGLENKRGGGVELSLKWLGWLDDEYKAAGGMDLSAARQLVRDQMARDTGDSEHPQKEPSPSAIGSVLTHVQQLMIDFRKLEPDSLAPADRAQLKQQLQPLFDLYNKLAA